MFYSHDILQKRGGKFGIVWIVATRQQELSRREYMSVRVRKTCEDIMDYIFLRVPGRTKEGARPRFSLYLSAQLLYGTVKVFSKQSKYLYDDTAHLMCNVRMSTLLTPSMEIDLKFDPTKQNLPELIGKADPISAEYDLDFGSWGFPTEESITIFEQEMLRETRLSPSLRLELSPSVVQSHEEMTAEALQAPHTVSSPDDIKLREDMSTVTEQVQIPGEKELPGFDGKEIDLVSEKEMEEIPITLADLLSPRKSRSRSTSSISDVQMTEDIGLLPSVQETPVKKRSSDEEPPTKTQGLPTSPGVTPIQPEEPRPKRRRVRASLPMELEPVPPSPARRKRKRRLQFIDIETQISKKQLKHNMISGKDTCIPYILPSTRPSTAEDLFARPGLKGLNHPKLVRLWQRNAVIKTNGWTEEEQNDPCWSTTERQEVERQLDIVEAERAREAITTDFLGPPDGATVQSSDSDTDRRSRRSKRLSEKPITEETTEREQAAEVEATEVRRGDSILSLEGSHIKDISIEIEKSRQSLEQSKEKIHDDSIGSRPRSRRGSDQISSEEEMISIDLVPEQPGASGLQPLETVLEEQEAVPAPVLPPTDYIKSPPTIGNYQDEMMRHIERKTATKTWTRFHTICGVHNTYRSYACKMFTALLDLCASQIVLTRQKVAFADIYIRRGPRW